MITTEIVKFTACLNTINRTLFGIVYFSGNDLYFRTDIISILLRILFCRLPAYNGGKSFKLYPVHIRY